MCWSRCELKWAGVELFVCVEDGTSRSDKAKKNGQKNKKSKKTLEGHSIKKKYEKEL